MMAKMGDILDVTGVLTQGFIGRSKLKTCFLNACYVFEGRSGSATVGAE